MLPLPIHPGSESNAAPASTAVSRRTFVSAATWSILATALASACGGGGGSDGPTGPAAPSFPAGSGATFSGNVLTITLASLGNLTRPNGFQVFGDVGGQQANVIVIHTGTDSYRAFTSICTHEACPVGSFDGQRIVCPCHGSEYDTSGRNVAGPAPRPLAEYRVALDATRSTLTVTKG